MTYDELYQRYRDDSSWLASSTMPYDEKEWQGKQLELALFALKRSERRRGPIKELHVRSDLANAEALLGSVERALMEAP